jgi:pimeloyl-ACP methyl ester carboxylesterase
MRARSIALGAAGAGVLAAVGATAATVAYLRREQGRQDPAAQDSFEVLDDLEHHTIPADDGGELHLVERGNPDGRPLLFVHGVTLSSAIWRYQLRDLASEFRVLALDQRGHGISRAGTDGYGLELLGRDLVTVLDKLDLHRAVVVGHSMGGFATMQLCVAHPKVVSERVAGIVLTNTAAQVVRSRSAWTVPVARRVLTTAGALPRPAKPNPAAVYLGSRLTFGKNPSPSQVRFIGDIGAALPPEIFTPSVLGFLNMDLRQGLRGVDVPALVVAGSHDRLTPVRAAREIAANLPGAELVVLPGAGHTIMLERHAELDRLITDFAAALP